MIKLPEHEFSYWMNDRVAAPSYPVLDKDREVDVAVIGGGIAGLSAAYMLKQAGLSVAVIEKKTIGSGITGHTTGKVTSQHGLCYAKLKLHLGEKAAENYGAANQAAMRRIEEIVTKEKIDCDWQRDDNYVFSLKSEEVAKLKQEAEIAQELGLPVSFETKTDLPFAVAGAVKFADQATFHARKYLIGLARAVDGNGSFVFEYTKARRLRDGNPGTVVTNHGRLAAKHIIITTNVPHASLARGIYCALEYPMTSYIVAGKLKHDVKGMYITPGNPLRSILPTTIDGERLLLIGGESHIPGLGGSSETRYQRLADYAKEHFDVIATHRWLARDYLSYDDVPLIGKLYPWSKNVYVATGFMKWGLSSGTVAGMILSDTILRRPNPWAATFDSNRLSPIKSIPRVFAKFSGLTRD